MADLSALADETAERIGAIAVRAGTVSRGVAFLTTASMALAYLVGLLVLHGAWRWGWLVVGLILCTLPAVAVWSADRRLHRVPPSLEAVADELATVVGEKVPRAAMFEITDREQTHEQDAPLVTLGKELVPLQQSIAERKDDLAEAWSALKAITTMPGLLAVGIVGSFNALILSVVAVLVALAT